MEKKHIMLKNISLVSVGIMISRILGYFRDMLVANVFGAGFYADAFYAAFRIPNLFRRLFGESSLNAAFVPVLSEYLQKEQKQKTEEFISIVTTVMIVFLFFITILGIIFSFPLTKLITWGFDSKKLFLTSRLLQIMFPYMIFICLAALGLSVLNCLKIFFVPAMSSSSLSISEIIFILLVSYSLPEEKRILGLAISVVLGGVLQLMINFSMLNSRYKIRLNFKKFFYYLKIPDVKRIYILFIPVVIGFSIDQINALVDTLCASFLKEGSITALYYSNRLMQLPLALFAISTTTVVLPQMSKEVVNKNYEELKRTIIYSIKSIIFFILPASLGLIVFGKQIIKVLFEHGRFDSYATLLTYSCLAFYSLGLLFFSTTKIFTSIFYALKQPKYPVKIAGCMVIVNFILNIILMQFLEVGGLALATSISSFLSTIFLYKKIKKILNIKFVEVKFDILKIFFVNFIFLSFLLSIKTFIKNYFVSTFIGIFGGILFYFLITKIFKIEETKIIILLIQKFLPNYD